jgi:hypothetical protein
MSGDTGDTVDTKPEGNTSTPAKRVRGRNWCLTFNNYTEENVTQMKAYISQECEFGVFQEEEGDEKTRHLQIVFGFKNAVSFNTIKKKWPKCHIEKCKNKKKSIEYCRKLDTRVGEVFEFNVPKGLKIIENLKPWQDEIVKMLLTEPDDRTINWVYDKVGNVGKTVLCKYICAKFKRAVYLSGKAADMKYAISEMVKKGNDPEVILLDFTRSTEGYVSYEGIESVKNGIFFSGKYESNMVMYNSPHVICFANWKPDMEKLSEDRWNIIKVKK